MYQGDDQQAALDWTPGDICQMGNCRYFKDAFEFMDLYKPESQAKKQDPIFFILLTTLMSQLKGFYSNILYDPSRGNAITTFRLLFDFFSL